MEECSLSIGMLAVYNKFSLVDKPLLRYKLISIYA